MCDFSIDTVGTLKTKLQQITKEFQWVKLLK